MRPKIIVPMMKSFFYKRGHDGMILQLKDLFDRAGERIPFEFDLDLSHVKHGADKPIKKPVHITGSVENSTGIVTLGYLAKFTLNTLCDRCLEPIEQNLSLSTKHIVVNELAGEDNDSFVVCEDYKLDLDELVTADIVLELPIRILCRDDCKGLCPRCGTNLNESTCNCETKQVDPRLEVLLQLLEEDEN